MSISENELLNPVVKQERAKGHDILPVTEKVYVEVSEFRDKTYVGIREWFKADNGLWYRTKKGINFQIEDFEDFIAQIEDITKFVMDKVKKTENNNVEEKEEKEEKAPY